MATVKYKVSGHEKFPFREGWLSKGLDLLSEEGADASVFNALDAADRLGVGSNMVKSIRFWMNACGLLEKNGNKQSLSFLGRIILQNDKYFEDTFTWWIIHSNLAKNKYGAIVWYLFFNMQDADLLSKDEIEQKIGKELVVLMNEKYTEKSFKDSLDVLLNMYTKQISRADDPEDKNVCPLATLGLVKKDGNDYLMTQPDIRMINEEVIIYELADMFAEEESLSIDRICSGENGLGNIYHLSRTMVNQFLDNLETKGYIKVNRTAGLDVVYAINLPDKNQVIMDYYK